MNLKIRSALKHFITLHLVVISAVPALHAQTVNQNYVQTRTPNIPIATDTELDNATPDPNKVQTTVAYMDGLGRSLQTVQMKGSPGQKDIIQPFAHDPFGRQAIKFLPYTLTTEASNGSYRSNALAPDSGQRKFYQTPTTGVAINIYPFSKTVFEPSELNRLDQQGAPGADWQPLNTGISTSGHTIKAAYGFNDTIPVSDAANTHYVAFYYVSSINSTTQVRTLARGSGSAGRYNPNQLYLTISRDENWTSGRGGTTEEYKDLEGRVVLKRTFNIPVGTSTLQVMSTYYVYDDLGNLAFVLPPRSNADNAKPSQTTLDNLCYQHRYDKRNRLTKKKLPGKGWEYVVYNKLNEPVLTQDSLQRISNQWTAIKHDALGRVIMTGIWDAGSALLLDTLQNRVYAAQQYDYRNYNDNVTGYTISSYPAITKILSINFYDNYNNIPSLPSIYKPAAGTYKTLPAGLLTASKTAVLNTIGNASPDMLWQAHYYDDKNRNIKTYKQHYWSGSLSQYNFDEVSSTYDYTDAITQTTRNHYTRNSGNTAKVLGVTIIDSTVYDHMGRKLKALRKVGSNAMILVTKNDYNEVGQLKTLHLHSTNNGTTFLQDIDYAYNERGWLSKINDPTITPAANKVFSMALTYNTGTTPQYNGNISGQSWNTKIPAAYSSNMIQGVQSYSYTYDPVNRLAKASYTTAGNVGKFDEELAYDLNGNITTLKRKNALSGYLNNLTYNYSTGGSGNKLWVVTDAGTAAQSSTYDYDGNGNVIKDTRNQITSIQYNLLNLPQVINRTAGNITYVYDAGGNKLRKISGINQKDYIDGIEYSGGTMDFVATGEGRATPNGTGAFVYDYYLKDHLGNVRAAVKQDGSINQIQDYYAFGLEMGNTLVPSPPNNYKYNEKEKQDETGQYDYGARFYDPVIARWTTIDPLAEKGRRWSPYAYGMDDPIRMVDPDGMWPFPVHIRSFAPFNTFGGGFDGDGSKRGFTTSSTATSRVAQTFTVDAQKGSLTGLKTYSSPSHHPLLGTATAKDQGSITNFKSVDNKDGSNTVSFTSNMAGGNPLTKRLDIPTPDIDVHTNFTLTENDKAGTLKVNAVQTGDAFPSAETFIGDSKGNQLFIGVSAANGSPYTSLEGDNNRPMMSANFTITMDGKGVFTGVQQGDKKYSTADWNKMNQNKPTGQ